VNDRATFALALAVCAGAWWSAPVPLVAAAAVVAVALVARRPVVLVVGGALLASALGARADAGLVPPSRPEAVAGEVVVLSDPVDVGGAIKLDVGLGDRRVEAWARGQPASVLRPLLAGERVVVRGRLAPPPPEARPWLARRHVSARLSVDEPAPSARAAWPAGRPTACAAPWFEGPGPSTPMSAPCSPASSWATIVTSRWPWPTTSERPG